MTTKEYLNQIDRLNKLIVNKTSELTQIKLIAKNVTIPPKEVNVQTSPDNDKMGNAIAKLVDLENEINMLISEYIEQRSHIITQIERMNNTDIYNVLFKRYVLCKDWSTISFELNFSFRNTMKLHKKALKEFEQLYGEIYM